ncbi:hypothetical protein [Halopseudomonas salina]|uniref:Uncharacterized protein n=1 Tax=Halopseudomonas salina TaxID=1323744 RepID=A0ABQ1PYR9_9GAMM|nr:hypothetical protein [Halopseudomonas salina]GGD07286.1 hypothetical protein GCM10007418_27880 [Halopseudomonas salina]
MTNLAEFRAAERKLAQQLAQLETMKQDAGLQAEMAFNEELRTLMDSYDYSPAKVLAILRSAPE